MNVVDSVFWAHSFGFVALGEAGNGLYRKHLMISGEPLASESYGTLLTQAVKQ